MGVPQLILSVLSSTLSCQTAHSCLTVLVPQSFHYRFGINLNVYTKVLRDFCWIELNSQADLGMKRREGPTSLWGTRQVIDKTEAMFKYADSVFVLMIISLKISLHLFIYFVCITVCLWKQRASSRNWFSPILSRDRIQVLRLGSQYLFPLSNFSNPTDKYLM